MSTFPPKVHSGPDEITLLSLAIIFCLLPRIRQLFSRSNYVSETAKTNFPLLFLTTFPRFQFESSDLVFLIFSVIATNLSMECSNRIFEKLHFTPKIRLNVFLKVKLPNLTDWHILPGLKIDVLIACRRLSVRAQNVECVSRYSASGHLQKFAADITLSTPQNS